MPVKKNSRSGVFLLPDVLIAFRRYLLSIWLAEYIVRFGISCLFFILYQYHLTGDSSLFTPLDTRI